MSDEIEKNETQRQADPHTEAANDERSDKELEQAAGGATVALDTGGGIGATAFLEGGVVRGNTVNLEGDGEIGATLTLEDGGAFDAPLGGIDKTSRR